MASPEENGLGKSTYRPRDVWGRKFWVLVPIVWSRKGVLFPSGSISEILICLAPCVKMQTAKARAEVSAVRPRTGALLGQI